MKPKHLAVLILLAAIWGASFLFIRLAVRTQAAPGNFPPITLAGIRIAVGALVLYAVLKLRGGAFPWHRWRDLAVIGLSNAALPYFLFAWGAQYIPSNLSAIYNATTPLFTVLLATLFVREERLSPLRSVGVMVGFLGIVYLFADGLGTVGAGGDRLELWGELACVAASFCYGISNMWARRRLMDLELMQLAAAQLVFGMFWLLPPIVVLEQPWLTLQPTPSAMWSLAVLSLLGTAFAQILYFYLLTQVGATRTAQVTYILPLFGLFWGWLIGETITQRAVGALLIVLVGLVIVNFGARAKKDASTQRREERKADPRINANTAE